MSNEKVCMICGVKFNTDCETDVFVCKTCASRTSVFDVSRGVAKYGFGTCEFCGDSFIKVNTRQKYCKKIHYAPCPVCGKLRVVTDLNYGPRACSEECRKIKTEKTSLEKYGTKNPHQSKQVIDKTAKTCIEKYGCSMPIQCDEIRKKAEQTNLQKYGTIYSGQSEEVKEKIRDSFIKKYGVSNPMKCDEVKNEVRQTVLKKYGFDNVSKSPQIKEKIRESQIKFKNSAKYQDMVENRKQTCLERYGVDHPSKSEKVHEKYRETMKERYGVEYPYQSSKFLKKARQSLLEHYGVEHPSQSSEIMNSMKETNLERYGVEWPIQLEEFQEKRIVSNLEKYGTEYTSRLESVKQKTQEACLEKYGVAWPCMRPEARQYHTVSKFNREFADKLDSYSIAYELEFPVENRSYDFHILNTNILIELDPTITHNSCFSIFDRNSNGSDPMYHYNKMNLARKHGYKCINIFDWDNKEEIVGNLFSNKEIVCDSEIVYCDLSKSDGQEYRDLGMKLVETIPPVKIWSKGFEMIFDKDVQDFQKLLEEGWLPVFNCGYEVYQ